MICLNVINVLSCNKASGHFASYSIKKGVNLALRRTPKLLKFLFHTADKKQNRLLCKIGKPIPKNPTARSASKKLSDAATPCRLFEINFLNVKTKTPNFTILVTVTLFILMQTLFKNFQVSQPHFRGGAGATACQFFGKLSGIRSSPAPLGFETKKNERLANSLFV